ncbi:hypothetical protein BDV93DRAFT_504995 [Ceratobasidium sp. AG-I]|nr:hypothetical protein BDV93DRAFT_504995 [Ceratobasidium sp. AG-I]
MCARGRHKSELVESHSNGESSKVGIVPSSSKIQGVPDRHTPKIILGNGTCQENRFGQRLAKLGSTRSTIQVHRDAKANRVARHSKNSKRRPGCKALAVRWEWALEAGKYKPSGHAPSPKSTSACGYILANAYITWYQLFAAYFTKHFEHFGYAVRDSRTTVVMRRSKDFIMI